MTKNVILILLLVVVLIKVFIETMVIETFDYSKECTDDLADSIAGKRKKEEEYKSSQYDEATNELPKSLANLKNSFQSIRGNVPQAYANEESHKELINMIIDNAATVNEKEKMIVAKGNLVDSVSRIETILNDGTLSNLADYQE